MKARNLFLSLGVATLALSGPVLAGNENALRQAVEADAKGSIRAAGSEMLARAGEDLAFDNHYLTGVELPELPAMDSVILIAESDAGMNGLEADAGSQNPPEPEAGFAGGLVVYSGNR